MGERQTLDAMMADVLNNSAIVANEITPLAADNGQAGAAMDAQASDAAFTSNNVVDGTAPDFLTALGSGTEDPATPPLEQNGLENLDPWGLTVILAISALAALLAAFPAFRLIMKRAAPWLIGWGAAFGVAAGFGAMLGPSRCRDGWASPSVGRSGACSHHGGVSGDRALLIVPIILAGWIVGSQVHRVLNPRPPMAPPPQRPAPARLSDIGERRRERYGPPRCPGCGDMMAVRLALRGKAAGRPFWSCGHYPACLGTRDTTVAHGDAHVADLGSEAIERRMARARRPKRRRRR